MNSIRSYGQKLLVALLTAAALLVSSSAIAQTIVGGGKVVDAAGQPVVGASVIEKGSTSNGVITDVNGAFQITVPASSQIEVSCIGYITKTVAPATNLVIVLDEDTTLLEETVVIGYGSVKKSNLISAVASMDSKSIEDRPMARAEQALQGQLAGVQVSVTNSEPGKSPQIRVRGAASISAGNDPLYVIDGVPQSDLSGVNPNDIASIEVLKDAASAAIYGSRGSNGVVLVTTQQGKKGAPRVSFNASYGIATLEKKIDLQTPEEWMTRALRTIDENYLRKYPQGNISDSNEQRLANLGLKATSTAYNFDPRWMQYLSPELRASHTYVDNGEKLSLLDWQEYMYQPAATQNYNVSISGATDVTKYMYSIGYMDQNGLYPGSNYKRISMRSNLETKLNNWVTVGMSLAPTYIINKGSGHGNGKDTQGHRVLSSTPVSEPGVGYNVAYKPNIKYLWAGTSAFPRQYNIDRASTNNSLGIQASAFIRLTPIKDLQIEGTAAVNYHSNFQNQFTNNTIINGNWLTKAEGESSSAGYDTSWSLNALMQVVANYNKSFGKHNISAMAGTSMERGNIGFSSSQGWKNLANDTIRGTFTGSSTTTTPTVNKSNLSQRTNTVLISAFARASYDYDGKYLVSASIRRDGYSRFGSQNKWGWFPSASAGWMVSNEDFFSDWNINWWDTFKLRASYGQTGNHGVSESAAYSTLSSGSYGDILSYVAGSFGNNGLGWEHTHSTDIAADFAFLNNKIQVSVDWYTKTTTDLLYSVPVPSVYGTSSTTDNLGSVYNSGFEIELNTHNITNDDFTWETQFNMSYNNNEVLQLGAENTTVYYKANGAYQVLEVGKPMYYFFGLKNDGVWMSQKEIDDYKAATGLTPKYNGKAILPGDLRHEDIDGDGNITDSDRQYLGKPTPDFTFGMTNRFTWKNFDASILFTAQTGGTIYGVIGRAIDRAGMGTSTNAMGYWRDSWWSEDEPGNGVVPHVLSTVKPDADSRFIYASDYFRIKNLTIGYTIPFKSFIRSARAYISVENLLIFDSYYHGYSPETSNGGKGGYDYGAYPSARTFTAGININF